jgi:plastocyanin
MHYTFLVTILVVVAMAYYLSQFAEAQTSERERCDAEVCHIKITRDGFIPKILTVKIGTTVVWTNLDDSRHTVTSGSLGEIKAPLKSLLLDKDDTYEFTFEHTGLYQGSYKYFDQVTKIMRGEIIVEPAPEETKEIPEVKTIKIVFSDPNSGVKKATLSNGNIMSMEIDPDLSSLIITVQTVDVNGKLTITLDRNLIDVKVNGNDDRFVVLADGKEAFYEETSSTTTERTLEIVVPRKTNEIKIVGTQVISVPSNINTLDQNVDQPSASDVPITEKSSTITPQIIEAKPSDSSSSNSLLVSNPSIVNASGSWILMLIGGSVAGTIYYIVVRRRHATKMLTEPASIMLEADRKITISIIPRSVTVSLGESVTFYAQAYDEKGNEVHDIDFIWSTTVKDAKLMPEGRSARFTPLGDAGKSDTRLFGIRKGEVIVSYRDTAASANVEIKEVK